MIDLPPAFFIPGADADGQEAMYAALAAFAGAAPLPITERIYSVAFRHDAEDWVATVGERLSGAKFVKRTVNGRRVEREMHLSDPAKVLAIFPGHPYRVVLDGTRSAWENPFNAGTPKRLVRFSRT